MAKINPLYTATDLGAEKAPFPVPKLPVEIVLDGEERKDVRGYEEVVEMKQKFLRDALRKARERQESVAHKRKAKRDMKRKEVEFRADDLVLLWEPHSDKQRKHLPRKATMRSTGPHKVLRKVTANAYVIAHAVRQREQLVDIKDMMSYHPWLRYREYEGTRNPVKLNCASSH